jgi:hypothetical protein
MPEHHFGRRDFALALLICLVWAGNFLTSAFALREIWRGGCWANASRGAPAQRSH